MEKIDGYKLDYIKSENGGYKFFLKKTNRSGKVITKTVEYKIGDPELDLFLDECLSVSKFYLEKYESKLENEKSEFALTKQKLKRNSVRALIYSVCVVLTAFFTFGPASLSIASEAASLLSVLGFISSTAIVCSIASLIQNKKFMAKSKKQKDYEDDIKDVKIKIETLNEIKNNHSKINRNTVKDNDSNYSKILVESCREFLIRMFAKKATTQEQYEVLERFYSEYGEKIEAELKTLEEREKNVASDIKNTSGIIRCLLSSRITSIYEERLEELTRRTKSLNLEAESDEASFELCANNLEAKIKLDSSLVPVNIYIASLLSEKGIIEMSEYVIKRHANLFPEYNKAYVKLRKSEKAYEEAKREEELYRLDEKEAKKGIRDEMLEHIQIKSRIKSLQGKKGRVESFFENNRVEEQKKR